MCEKTPVGQRPAGDFLIGSAEAMGSVLRPPSTSLEDLPLLFSMLVRSGVGEAPSAAELSLVLPPEEAGVWSALQSVLPLMTASTANANGVTTSGTGNLATGSSYFYRVRENADTDGDGIYDADEVTIYKSNAFSADTDGDGLSDGEEKTRGTNLLTSDSDNDGLADAAEVGAGLNPLSTDSDQDGLVDGPATAANLDAAPNYFDLPTITVLSSWRKITILDEPDFANNKRNIIIERSGYGQTGYPVGISRLEPTVSGAGAVPPVAYTRAIDAWAMAPVYSRLATTPLTTAETSLDQPLTAYFWERREGYVGKGFKSYPTQTGITPPAGALLYRYIRQEARVFERTLRLKASRPMPINWTIPVPTIYQFENYDIVSRSSQYNFDGTESSGYT